MKNKVVLFTVITGLSLIFFVSWSMSNKKPLDYRTVAPNGESIAENLDKLKSILNSSVNAKFKTKQDFNISEITFLKNKFSAGIIANVEFKTASGYNSNVVLFKNIPSANIISEGKALDNTYSQNEVIKVTCTGGECCQVHVHIGDDNNIHVDCTCSPCGIRIE
ncbi:MAG: hypothetical protein J0H55_06985 [Chitinophagaceae bacterium]|nr:hypothetical protein [Chitinophagaceae bacterium]